MRGRGQFEEELLVVIQGEAVVGARDEDEVVAAGGADRQAALGESEGLTEESLEAVARDRAADALADGEAESRIGKAVGEGVEGERAALALDLGLVDGVELAGVGESEAAGEGEAGRDHS